MSNRRGRLADRALALGALLLLALLAQPATAGCGAVTVVETEAQLNAAIETFNAITTSDTCVFTIRLTSDIDLTDSTTPIQNVISGKSMIIAGDGHQVDGQGIPGVRPFRIMTLTTVTINGLTLTGGELVGSGVENRGGAILNEGSLTVRESTVIANSVEGDGGGIANNRGTVVIIDSTIAGNTAGPGGGGIDNVGGPMTIRNSTISGNEALSASSQGGGIRNTHDLTLDSVTIFDNGASDGGGIFFSTTTPNTLTIGNTILAENGFGDCYFRTTNGSATVNDLGYNLVLQEAPLNPCGFGDGDNNIFAFAEVQPLADNGGPTPTHALEPTSNAIDNGATTLTTDQRGAARPSGASADIGAYESQGCGDSPWSVTNLKELNVAIACFNEKRDPGSYVISIDHGISATASTTPIDNDADGVELVIQGNGNGGDWNGNLIPGVRPFQVEAGSKLTIEDFAITGGNVLGLAPEFGGAILNRGDLTLVGCVVNGSIAYWGGGIYNANGGRLTVLDSEISGNEATERAGGIYSRGTGAPTSLSLKNSTVSRNVAPSGAGGVDVDGPTSTADIDSTTIARNTGTQSTGAGINVVAGASATLVNTIAADNEGNLDCYFISVGGSSIGGDHNLIETGSSCAGSMTDTLVTLDPLLGILRNNGGSTRTHALMTGSPAIDAGDTDLAADQRGAPRPSGATDDMGAFEEAQVGTITVVKETPVPSTTDYHFTLDGDPLETPVVFALDTSQDDPDGVFFRATFDLEAGAYALTEDVLPGQELGPVFIACEDNQGPIGNFTGATADIVLEVYQDVTCTFSNDTIYRVGATVDAGLGAVSCSPEFVGKGGSSTCTAVPEPGFQVRQWAGACAGAGSSTQCFLPKILEDQVSTVVFEPAPGGRDDDNDGVPNGDDRCADTPFGTVVDQQGCAIDQLCSCEQARNHGQYVSCVARTSITFVRAGFIDKPDRRWIMAEAARSQCGK